MSKPADDERLLAVAGSVSDGMPVDWNEVRQRFSDSDDSAIVDELQVLHGLASVHLEPSTWGPLQTIDALGRGSFATVYRAFDTDLQREIALKVSVPQESGVFDPLRAVREARLLARVRHPNVVTVFSAQRRGEAVALAMELIKGRTLDELVQQHGPFSAKETTLIGLDLCRALAAVHEAGLLHGDIKAHNVMREEGGRIVLMDFGTGRDLHAVPVTGDFAGTPLYLAPEVFAGQPRTTSSDIYSLGILLYYLSTGTFPVTGETRTAIDRLHQQSGTRRRLRDARPDLPAAFVTVVERAVAEDPAERYQTAGEFEAALGSTLEPHVDPQPNRSRKHRFLTVGAASLAALGLFAIVFYGIDRSVEHERAVTADLAGSAIEKPASPPAGESGDPYRVEAAMHRVRAGVPERLRRSDRLAPRDELFLQVQTSAPTYVYVVNEDERGAAFLLYPLPGQPREALPADVRSRLPGMIDGEEMNWQVSSRGKREHFVIFFTPTRVPEIEQLLASLPPPRPGAPIEYTPVPPEVVGTLRGVGGLVPSPRSKSRPRLSEHYTTPLSEGPEDGRGLLVRHVAFENK